MSEWIMAPFNTTYIIVFAAFIAVLVIASLLLKKTSEKTRSWVIAIAMIITFISFWIYKYFVSIDEPYAEILRENGLGDGSFTWFNELPLHLCNINMMLIPIAVWTKRRPLLFFVSLIGPLGAILALIMPSTGFDAYPLLEPRIIGYYFTHFMVLIGGLSVMTFGLFKPKFKDIPAGILAMALISLVIFGINMLLRATGLNEFANYFYNVGPETNPILNIFWNFLPVPYLYELCAIVILAPYLLLVTFGFWLFRKKPAAEAVPAEADAVNEALDEEAVAVSEEYAVSEAAGMSEEN